LRTTIGELPDNDRVAAADEEQPAPAEALGMHFSPLTSELRRDLHLGKDVNGVVVERVDSGSPADDVGLRDGDVLASLNQHAVNTPQEAAGKLKEIAASSKKSALLLLNRHGVTQYVGVSLGEYRGEPSGQTAPWPDTSGS
jgi:serine protease Do